MTETYYYSAENNAFYAMSMKEDYEQAESWPDDAMQISTVLYQSLLQGQAKGMLITPNEQGEPTLKKPPVKTKAEQVEDAHLMKESLMLDATSKILPLQDAVELSIATEAEEKLLLEWKKYRVLLNRLDTSIAPDIEWPNAPN